MDALPVVDVASLVRGEPAADVVRALRTACEDVGFFYAAGHGIDPALERRLGQATRAFFRLPEAEREAMAMARGGRAWRGYFPVGGELTSGRGDLKEGLYFGRELPRDDPRVRAGLPLHGPNLFPGAVPELRGAVLAWMAALEALGQRLLSGIALGLGLEADFFERELTCDPICLFRIFHYPPAAGGGSGAAWGVGEHTDYGLLTLLLQDDCGGLEVKGRAGWIAAPPIPGTFVCNLGDMLDRMTGGRYRSTPHRVRNLSGRSRFSWPFFLDPAFAAEVRALPGADVRPAELDAAERWDRASVHTLSGTYGDYLAGKVSKVFPELRGAVLPGR
jgi:isopenicillin N synthase-like dioxygenase